MFLFRCLGWNSFSKSSLPFPQPLTTKLPHTWGTPGLFKYLSTGSFNETNSEIFKQLTTCSQWPLSLASKIPTWGQKSTLFCFLYLIRFFGVNCCGTMRTSAGYMITRANRGGTDWMIFGFTVCFVGILISIFGGWNVTFLFWKTPPWLQFSVGWAGLEMRQDDWPRSDFPPEN